MVYELLDQKSKQAIERTAKVIETYKAVLFFVASDLLRVALLVAFPVITLVLIPII